MNVKFVLRGSILSLLLALAMLAAWVFFQSPLGRPLEPTPPPPTILAPHGAMPTAPAGLQALAQYQGETFQPVASGFLLVVDNRNVIGVTTAHSFAFGNPDRLLERIALALPGEPRTLAEFDTLRGLPGRSTTASDLTPDYVLLQASQPITPELALFPDPRGGPQAGERVWLLSGTGPGNEPPLEGTVQSVGDSAVWILMDRWFNPIGMSGSPVVSEYTGQVVGMVVVGGPRRNRVLIGIHPIGSLVRLAVSTAEFPKIVDVRK
jgi:hypothetical protein